MPAVVVVVATGVVATGVGGVVVKAAVKAVESVAAKVACAVYES